MPGTPVNWDRHNRKRMGREGKAARPYFNAAAHRVAPTQKQIEYVGHLVKELEDAGVPAQWVLEGRRLWSVSYRECEGVLYTLKKMRIKHLEGYAREDAWRPVYENLCRNMKTGERVKYKTKNRFAHPKGYEFLGELCMYMASPDEREKLPVIVHYVKKEAKEEAV